MSDNVDMDNLPVDSQPQHDLIHCPAQEGLGVGAHAMGVWSWGDAADDADHLVVCVHGLTRQGRDFDGLARALLGRDPGLAVLCPDVVGRGSSPWLSNPLGYQIPLYVADMLHWLGERHARTPIRRLDWVGTSMGGLIGLILAAQPAQVRPFPLTRLVLNDVGPSLPWAFVERLRQYVGQPLVFPDVQAGARALRDVATGFGPHTDEAWLALSTPMFKPLPQGGVGLHYDPAIVEPIRQLTPEAYAQSEALLWTLYDQIMCPTLLLRGVESDVLSAETAQAMTQRGPRATCLAFDGVGHAPTLLSPEQVEPVLDWLLA
jgi:pimeloyl-ACP methyl ester carboxylesterase